MKHHFALRLKGNEYKNRIRDRESVGNLNSCVHTLLSVGILAKVVPFPEVIQTLWKFWIISVHFLFLTFTALEFLAVGQHWKCQDTFRNVAAEKFPSGLRSVGNLKRQAVLCIESTPICKLQRTESCLFHPKSEVVLLNLVRVMRGQTSVSKIWIQPSKSWRNFHKDYWKFIVLV